MTKQSHVQDVVLNSPKFNYKWSFKDYPKKNGLTVMSTFACGGGSTMGYKLAGFDVIAANDIDPQMAKVYKANHKPEQFFECGIKDLLKRNDLPIVDILDGSPPCSVFSVAGLREDSWQKDKKFREGQSKQVLDDLFFDFINLAEKMKSKVIIAENVKGMLIGNAKWYTREIVRRFKNIGYTCQVFLLDASTMGVPQKRERVFFIANKQNKKIAISFNNDLIAFNEVSDESDTENKLTPLYLKYYNNAQKGQSVGKFKQKKKLHNSLVSYTVVANGRHFHPDTPRELNDKELKLIGSFPQDYDFQDIEANYLIGMSVPPVMMAQIAYKVKEQLL